MVLTTVRVLRKRLSAALLVAAAYALTVGRGVLPALFVMLGECPVGGSSGC